MQAQGANPLPAQHPARPGENTPFMVANAIFICGIYIPTLFKGNSQAKRIAGKLFHYDFVSCMDKTVKESYDDLNSYSTLTAANGQIRLNPGQKKDVKTFIQ